MENYLKEEPENAFNRYALAMEYLATDRDKSLQLLEHLLTHHEDYLPTYYQAGLLYAERNDTGHAVRVVEKGIAKARAAGDHKTLAELKSLYEELLPD